MLANSIYSQVNPTQGHVLLARQVGGVVDAEADSHHQDEESKEEFKLPAPVPVDK